jgi:quercetin dioxygenase-like cupin family protein
MKIFADASQEPAYVMPDGTQRRVLSYGGNLMLVEFRFAAGVASALHSHPHEQVGYIVSGEIEFIAEGKPAMRLITSGSYYVPPNVKHNIVTLVYCPD